MKLITYAATFLIVVLALPAVLPAQSIVDGAVAYYPLDGHANDESGNHHNGLIYGPVATADRYDNPGGALLFDGVNDYVQTPGLDLRYSDKLSIQAWIKTTGIASEHYKVFIRQDPLNSGAPDFALDFKNTGKSLVFAVNTDASYSELFYAIEPADVADGEWHHVVGTYDGSYMRLYLDGSERASMEHSGNLTYQGGQNRIGCMRSKHFFPGAIDDVCYYDRALSAEEILNLYNGKDLDENNSAQISGAVYFDENADCARENGETGCENRLIKASPGPYYGWTDASGNYSIRLPEGDYTIELMPRAYWQQSCPQSGQGYDISVTNPGTSIGGLDFGSVTVGDIEALALNIAGSRARPGFTVSYRILYRNIGTVPFSGTVYLELDEQFTFVGSVPAASAYNPPVVEWQLNDIPVDAGGIIELQVRLDAETPLGSEVCSYVYAEGQNPANHLLTAEGDSYCHEVEGSYDPNDISVNPAGRFYDPETVFTYRIRFQNTGTAPASKVVVVDTLPEALDINTLRLGAVSHDYVFSIDAHNVLRWTFNGIELPDSNADEAGSHGYIQYRIAPRSDIAIGSRIANRAAIYFDYNKPVITNTAESVLELNSTSVDPEQEALTLTLFPNPAGSSLKLRSENVLNGELVLSDILGRRVLGRTINNSTELHLDVSSLSEGRYFLSVPGASGILYRVVEIRR